MVDEDLRVDGLGGLAVLIRQPVIGQVQVDAGGLDRGVPGLGLKRGLEEDLVIAPYASVLALSIRPRAVVQNLDRLIEMGMLGLYGFYEALDFAPIPEPGLMVLGLALLGLRKKK